MVELAEASGELFKLATLFDATQLLSGGLPLRDAIERVLEILEQRHDVLRSAVTLLDDATGELFRGAWSPHPRVGSGAH